MAAGLQMQEKSDRLVDRQECSLRLANALLRHSADNEDEASAIFKEELDRCVDPLDREKILIDMGTGGCKCIHRQMHWSF